MTPANAAPQKCPNCGAAAARVDARYCEYCGRALPAPAAPPAPASPFGDVAARFRALDAHPDLPRLLAENPSAPELASERLMTIVSLLVFGAVGLFVSIGFFAVCPPLGLLPVAMIVIGAYALLRHVAKTSAASRAPLERRAALVVDERTKITGGGEHTSARTHYFATLQFTDGSRREFDVFDGLAGRITPGDVGVAYSKGEYLIEFGRVSV